MWLSLKTLWKKYRFSSMIFVNFFKIFIVVFVIVSAASVFFYQMKVHNTKEELNEQSNSVAQGIYRVIGEGLDNAVKAGGNLAVDNDIRSFIYAVDGTDEMDELRKKILTKMTSFKSMVPFVSSIYVYSEKIKNSINIGDGYDDEWLKYYPGENDGSIIVVPRKISGNGYKMITIIFTVNINNLKGAVVVNCNYTLINRAVFDTFDRKNDLFIVSGDEIIYSSSGFFSNKDTDNHILSKVLKGKDGIITEHGDMYSVYSDKMTYNDWNFINIRRVDEYDTFMASDRLIIFIILINLFIITVIVSFAAAVQMAKPVYYLLDIAKEKSDGNVSHADNEVKLIATKIIELIDDNDYLKNELNNRLKMYNELQISALQTQINPHFLNNALNMVNMMAAVECGSSDVSKAILIIAKLMRYSYITDEIMVSIHQETEYLEDYIKLIGVCYPSVAVNINVDEDTYDSKIVRMCIQPLVENSIYHGGLSGKKDGRIDICIESIDNNIKITVSDNGKGMEHEALKNLKELLDEPVRSDLKIGMSNVYKRLMLVFGDEVVFDIQSQPGMGTKIGIVIPNIKIGH